LTPIITTFEQLDAELTDHPDAPDTALDLVYMMKDADWEALLRAIALRSVSWREGCAYVLGEGPPEGLSCLELLRADPDSGVAAQAEDSIVALTATRAG
jgi:hypothetical protein